MVYHYSDGVLEYEEHFNSAGTLQELLKYSYDAEGNVEYLLYKDNNFSNANAFDLYYYVRDGVGNIRDLFQIREQSGSSTTVVNRVAAHYEYDPYGNILSIDKYNNDPIGDINPIRYKDYYYDLQTGWYQLTSRFYDPEVGRFLNADDVSLLMETDSSVVDKNLYAYCDGNPVMRKDDEGDFWQIGAAFAGAVIGASFDIGSQILSGQAHSLKDINWKSVGVSAASGAVTAVAGPLAGAAISGISSGYQSYKDNGNLKMAVIDGTVSAGLSYVCGGGYKATKLLKESVKKSGLKNGVKDYKKQMRNVVKKRTKSLRGKFKEIGRRSFWGAYSTQKYTFYYTARKMYH